MKFIHSQIILFLSVSFFLWESSQVFGQCNSPVVFNTPGEYSFFVPAGVNSLEIEVWGAGAGGGGRTTNGTGGGGGGGAYSRSEINVVPGTVYTVSIGAGGLSNNNGGDSWVALSDAISNKKVLAKGGQSPDVNNVLGGVGGSSAIGIGTFRFSGGNGATASLASPTRSGGGGSSAGIGIDGNTSTNQNGAIAPVGGGPGGDGATVNGQDGNSPATSPGGGGGGARGANRSGGTGANGRVRISYNCQIIVGGTLVDDGALSGNTIIEFTTSGENRWTAPKGLVEFEVFVVGGGGGGGMGNAAGGGGGGGVTSRPFTDINFGQGFAEDTELIIIVGSLGPGTIVLNGANARGANGGVSIFGFNNPTFQTAAGGGIGGASAGFTGVLGSAIFNGSGGGVNGLNTQSNGNGMGNNGSQGINENTGGGGGGAGSPGTPGTITDPNPLITATGGNGGNGFASDFRGNLVIYAGGGGGTTSAGSNAPRNIAGLGGIGSGGNANNSGIGLPGSTRGSGGGAGRDGGGAGNTGVVIIRYPNFRILPVEHLYFDANFKREEKLVEVKWATSKEWENSYFEVQRSLQNVKNWEGIGTVDGMGWSDSPVEYLFKDPNLPLIGGLAYYRLKQVDYNGDFDLSKTVSVRLPSLQHFEGVWRVFPNPNDGEKFSLELLDEKEYNGEALRVRLISPKASAMAYSGSDLREISELIRAQLAKSPKGVYIVEVSWGQKVEYLKVLRK